MTAWGGYKGSGLAIMVQLLGIAAGSSEPTPPMSDFGYLFIAFDPSVLQTLDGVKQDADKFAESIRSTRMLPERHQQECHLIEVVTAGEMQRKRLVHGRGGGCSTAPGT
jgi:LDH2 family malate/lactate/ureidoglycolate dehydrogenase